MTTLAPPPESYLRTEPTRRERWAALVHELRPTRGQLVDAGFTAVLVLVALLGLRTTYDGWLWAAPGVVGLVLGVVVTHVVLGVRLPGAVVLLALTATYVVVGGAVATREDLVLGVVPTGGTLAGLAHAAVLGWKELLTSLPPVDARGQLMALPLLMGLLGGAAAYGVAIRWRAPALVVPVPLGLLTLSLLLGTSVPAAQTLMGLGTGLLVIAWVAVRARAARPAVDRGLRTDRSAAVWRATTTAVLLGLAAAGGLVVGPHLPGDDGGRTVWRTALVPPYDVTVHPSPLAGFRRYTEPNPAKLYDRTLFTLSGLPAGTPVRLATLDSYDGSVWGAGTHAADGQGSEGATFQRVGSHLAASGPGTPVTMTVTIPDRGWSDVWLPTVGTVTGVQFLGQGADGLADDLRFNVDTGTGIVPGGLQAGDSYRLEADVPPAPAAKLPADLAVAAGTLLDTQDAGFVDDRLSAWSANLSSPWARLAAAARAMSSEGAYTDGGTPGSYQNVFLPGHSTARMTRFFKSTQLAGDDEQYASALALVGNRIGVPTRVVLGAIPEDAAGGQAVVKGKDVHAWVEVQEEDGTWYPVLPQTFVPDRNKQPQQQQTRSEEKQVGAQVPPPVSSNPPSVLQGPDQAQSSTQVKRPPRPSVFDPASWPTWLRVLLEVVAVILLLTLVYLALRLSTRRRGRRRRTRGSLPDRVAGGWAEIVDTAQDLGLPLAPRLTRLEQAGELDLLMRDHDSSSPEETSPDASSRRSSPSVRPLAQEADALVFAADDPDPEQVTVFWQQVDSVTRRLRRRASFWQRLRADVSLGSLLRARRDRPEVRREPAPGRRRLRVGRKVAT